MALKVRGHGPVVARSTSRRNKPTSRRDGRRRRRRRPQTSPLHRVVGGTAGRAATLPVVGTTVGCARTVVVFVCWDAGALLQTDARRGAAAPAVVVVGCKPGHHHSGCRDHEGDFAAVSCSPTGPTNSPTRWTASPRDGEVGPDHCGAAAGERLRPFRELAPPSALQILITPGAR